MSRRSALLVAILAALVVAGFFFWPEPARADIGFSARIGAGFGHSSVGARLHSGGGVRGAIRFGDAKFRGHGSFHGDRKFDRRGSLHGERKFRGRGPLLGERFRRDQFRRLTGHGPRGALLGDRLRFEQARRISDGFLAPDRIRDRHARKFHRHGHRGLSGKFLRPKPLLVPTARPVVVVRQIIVQAPAPARRSAAAEPEPLDPRGPVTLVGEEDGVVGDWAPGDVLPRGVPHVTLDPVAYGLPDPPFGEKYARVGNDVLRIDAGTRRINEVVAR